MCGISTRTVDADSFSFGTAVVGLLVGPTMSTGIRANGDQPRAFERAHSQSRSRCGSREKHSDNNNKIRERSALQEPSQIERGGGSDNAGAFYAPAPVVVVQPITRRLYSTATALFDGVIDGESLSCSLGRYLSPASSPTSMELPRRAPGPLTLLCECTLPLAADPHSL